MYLFNLKTCLEDIEDMSLRHVPCLRFRPSGRHVFIRHYQLSYLGFYYAWSEITFKFFAQALFCWMLACVYHIHWISVHWSWNCPRVLLQIASGPYPNRAYGFTSPAGLWKNLDRVLVFVIEPVKINKFIGFKSVPQVIKVWSCAGKFWPKGHKILLG